MIAWAVVAGAVLALAVCGALAFAWRERQRAAAVRAELAAQAARAVLARTDAEAEAARAKVYAEIEAERARLAAEGVSDARAAELVARYTPKGPAS